MSVLSVRYTVGFVILVSSKQIKFPSIPGQSSVISVNTQREKKWWEWIKSGEDTEKGRTQSGKLAVWLEISNPTTTYLTTATVPPK